MLERPPPAGFGRWTGPLIAAELGDVHEQQVWRFLREQRIDLDGSKSWCESDDAEFVAKAADVVGLYLAPPEDAIVICVDEKPSIQALERAQGYLKLPNGRTLSGHSHDYKRHGTTTLFAALDLATGKVAAAHKKRRRRVEFLDFMNEIVADYPDKEIHVVLDNLNTHKKNDRWLTAHPNVRFHFTPTRASWLNQVEIWFSILAGKSLRGASFTSIAQLRQHIDFPASMNKFKVPEDVQAELRGRGRTARGGYRRDTVEPGRGVFCRPRAGGGTAGRAPRRLRVRPPPVGAEEGPDRSAGRRIDFGVSRPLSRRRRRPEIHVDQANQLARRNVQVVEVERARHGRGARAAPTPRPHATGARSRQASNSSG